MDHHFLAGKRHMTTGRSAHRAEQPDLESLLAWAKCPVVPGTELANLMRHVASWMCLGNSTSRWAQLKQQILIGSVPRARLVSGRQTHRAEGHYIGDSVPWKTENGGRNMVGKHHSSQPSQGSVVLLECRNGPSFFISP